VGKYECGPCAVPAPVQYFNCRTGQIDIALAGFGVAEAQLVGTYFGLSQRRDFARPAASEQDEFGSQWQHGANG